MSTNAWRLIIPLIAVLGSPPSHWCTGQEVVPNHSPEPILLRVRDSGYPFPRDEQRHILLTYLDTRQASKLLGTLLALNGDPWLTKREFPVEVPDEDCLTRLRRVFELIDHPEDPQEESENVQAQPQDPLLRCWRLYDVATSVSPLDRRMPVLDAIEACERLSAGALPDSTARALHLQMWGECLEIVADLPLEARDDRLAAAEAAYRRLLNPQAFERMWHLQGHFRLGNLYRRWGRVASERATWLTIHSQFRDFRIWHAYHWAELHLKDD